MPRSYRIKRRRLGSQRIARVERSPRSAGPLARPVASVVRKAIAFGLAAMQKPPALARLRLPYVPPAAASRWSAVRIAEKPIAFYLNRPAARPRVTRPRPMAKGYARPRADGFWILAATA